MILLPTSAEIDELAPLEQLGRVESDYSSLGAAKAVIVVGMTDIPATDVDLFTDEALSDPYPLYQELRALRPVVRLTASEMYAFPPMAFAHMMNKMDAACWARTAVPATSRPSSPP
jgi:hypothetical protein